MKITDKLIENIHQVVNKRIYKEFPALDLSRHPEGSIKRWEVKYILEAYNEVRK